MTNTQQILKDAESKFGKELWEVAQEKIPSGQSTDYYEGVMAAYLHIGEVLRHFFDPSDKQFNRANLVLVSMATAAYKNYEESFPTEL